MGVHYSRLVDSTLAIGQRKGVAAGVAAGACIAAGLLLALCLSAALMSRAEAASADDDGLSVTGRILNERAEPISGATVYVYSAGVREGTSPYCPTCYVDCGKRVMTDADGRFTIGGLDATLVFRLLAVAVVHRPEFITNVDPQDGEAVKAKLAVRPIPEDPAYVVRGQVIDPQGLPAAGAVVESFGCKTAERRWWGRMDGVDPLAVTDEGGEFAIVCDAPVLGLDLRVEARGAARKNFELVSSGGASHRLELQRGAAVTGRVLDEERPLAGMTIGICQADRGSGKFLGPYQIDTDDEGRFNLANLPSEGELLLYGIMSSLPDGLALPVARFAPADGAVTDLGDLSVVPAYTVRGRVALADGNPVPPRTRVMFGREGGWDSHFVEAADDGSFSIGGIPPEVIQVIVQIPGYRLSPKNKSYDSLNRYFIKGLVSDDVEDLVILYEPGETVWERNDQAGRDGQAAFEKYQRLRTEPLAGVTATLEEFPPEEVPAVAPAKPLPRIVVPPRKPAPATVEEGGATITVTGTVIDHQGQSIDKGQVWLPVQWLSPFEILTATAHCDGGVPFRLTLPQAWLPSNETQRLHTVWAYAPGHAIGIGNAQKQLLGEEPAGPFQIEVPPAEDLSFVVLLPDGSPAIGAKVAPLHLKGSQGYEYVPRELVELVAGTTDTDGRAALPALTRDGVYTIDVVLAGYGTQRFRCSMKSTTPAEQTLRLRHAGRVEGRIAVDQLDLTRDMFVSIETTQRDPVGGVRMATGVAVVMVDDRGQFAIPEIAEGRLEVFSQCDERLPVRARLPESGAISLLAGETVTVQIPLEMAVRVRGLVRTVDTQEPLVGAMLHVRYSGGRQTEQVVTDEKGQYSALALAGEVYVQVFDPPEGYQQAGEPWNERLSLPADAEEYAWPTIEVVPTRDIAGTLIDLAGNPLANVRIGGILDNRRYGFGQTDANGAFTLGEVPLGIQLEEFEVWTRDERLTGVVETTEPLVVRLKE